MTLLILGCRGRVASTQPGQRHTGFEDSNSCVNVGSGSKATGQAAILTSIGENLALLNDGSNDESVLATVPASASPSLRIPDPG